MIVEAISKVNGYSDLYRGVRVAVLGASGFIGRWVAHALCAGGADVYLVVRKKAMGETIFADYGIHGNIVIVDLLDSNAVFQLFQRVRPSITFNLAGYGVDRSERNESTAYEINASLISVICAAIAEIRDIEWPGQDIVHVGSALEYGTIAGNLAEDSAPNPTTLYGKSKLAGTLRLADWCRTKKIKGLTARLFTVYGPGEHEGRLLPSLFGVAATGNVLRLTEGKQRRDFAYVEDVAEGLLRLGLIEANPGEILNLATGKLTTIREFAETAAKILRISGDKLKFGALATRTEEMAHSEVAIERLHQLSAWVPSTRVEQGIRKTAAFVRAHSIRGD